MHISLTRTASLALVSMVFVLAAALPVRAGGSHVIISTVSQGDILEHLYDFNSERFSNVVAVYISALRRRFDPKPPHKLIHTLRGHGYLLGELPP